MEHSDQANIAEGADMRETTGLAMSLFLMVLVCCL